MKALCVLVLASVLLPGCGRHSETGTDSRTELATAEVQVQIAESKQGSVTEEVVGTVEAKLHATLEAKLSGRIIKMPVLLGQAVKTGQLIAHLDAAEITARHEQAEASLEQAQRDWKRISALFDQQAATRSDYDAADSRVRVAKAGVSEAQAMMGYVEILAPFDGVVTKKWADVGDLAAPGKPLISIEDPSRLQLEADVPEGMASRIQLNARLIIRSELLKDRLEGTVKEIAPTIDPVSRTFRLKLDLPPTAGLVSGQFARLVVPIGESNSVRVPASAVVLRGQLEILFVVTNQRARLHLVKTGKRIDDQVEILAGIEPGDSIVTGGAALLTDGQPVRLQ